MNKKISVLLIILFLVILLVLFFIFYGHNLSNLIKKLTNAGANTNQENVATRGDVGEIMIQLKDAEDELNGLRELAEDQESLAKIDLLFEKIEAYKKELKKPRQEIKKETIEDFYNSGLWEEILDLKNKIELTKKSDPTQK